MKLRDTILSCHSKVTCNRIVRWAGHNSARFDQLIGLFLHDEPLVVQRAAWPLSEIVCSHPRLIQPYLGELLRYYIQPGHHDAVRRSTVRMLQWIEIPEAYQGIVMNHCFEFLLSPTEKPGVKAFSLTVLQNLSRIHPDIRQELKTVIHDRWSFETPAFHARAKKILRDPG